MSELRAQTAGEHRELENVVAINERLQSVESYRQLLEVFYGFVVAMEWELARFDWGQFQIRFEDRRKANLLEHDLRHLGVEPTTVPCCAELPAFQNQEEAAGALYVLEGSTLGGRYISQLAAKAEIPYEATAYFRSYGERVREMWTEFAAQLNRFIVQPESIVASVDGARKTFDAFRGWFAERLVPAAV